VSALEGKVAIVTGGAQGIGRAIADALAADGARIVIADLQGAEQAAADFPDGVGLTVDVASEDDVARMAAETVERCGAIDILVNNAGLYASLAMRPFEQIPVAEWRQVMDVNVLSMFLTCRAIVALTRALAKELGGDDVLVNCVAPGFTMSDGVREHPEVVQALQDVSVGARTLKRDQVPEDVVGAVAFLCGPGATFITGQTMVIDGGQYFH
jgi:NAD(P)-dependent dehydrogenase (short-subunit alcohol dehydrogenase family)